MAAEAGLAADSLARFPVAKFFIPHAWHLNGTVRGWVDIYLCGASLCNPHRLLSMLSQEIRSLKLAAPSRGHAQ